MILVEIFRIDETRCSRRHVYESKYSKTRIALSRAHTSAKAADFAKLLSLNKRQIIDPLMRSTAVSPTNRKLKIIT